MNNNKLNIYNKITKFYNNLTNNENFILTENNNSIDTELAVKKIYTIDSLLLVRHLHRQVSYVTL
jgi:hypothetical protein